MKIERAGANLHVRPNAKSSTAGAVAPGKQGRRKNEKAVRSESEELSDTDDDGGGGLLVSGKMPFPQLAAALEGYVGAPPDLGGGVALDTVMGGTSTGAIEESVASRGVMMHPLPWTEGLGTAPVATAKVLKRLTPQVLDEVPGLECAPAWCSIDV
jgi:hypothetical protein